VAFSRDEVTGAPEPSGDFLPNAQGEDVVSGVRTPRDIAELAAWQPAIHSQLMDILRRLERHYGDMQDTEFTVEEGRLYLLQTRSAKRPAQAAVRFAVDAVREGLLDKAGALVTIEADKLDALLHATFDPDATYDVLARGVAASAGAAKGAIVFTADEAVEAAAEGHDVVLMRPFTEAEDVAGFYAACGVITAEGGKASHAALVARGMGVPAVTGAATLEIDVAAGEVRVAGTVALRRGDRVAIDGTTGCITRDDVPLVEPQMSHEFRTVLGWADEIRRLDVRANADTPQDAAKARELGACGIGLCRTEHMFLGERQPLMAEVILAADDAERDIALKRLRALQREDFAAIFTAMDGLPVTIRLLDPPLHEFLPKPDTLPAGARRDRVVALQEANPMLGTRGVRLGILYPTIYAMQIEAIALAMADARRLGPKRAPLPTVEVMVPLVVYGRELTLVIGQIETIMGANDLARGQDYAIGTMIELPRACLRADEIAGYADFFSFGTNDLMQTALGFSRDDIEGRILARYIEMKVFDRRGQPASGREHRRRVRRVGHRQRERPGPGRRPLLRRHRDERGGRRQGPGHRTGLRGRVRPRHRREHRRPDAPVPWLAARRVAGAGPPAGRRRRPLHRAGRVPRAVLPGHARRRRRAHGGHAAPDDRGRADRARDRRGLDARPHLLRHPHRRPQHPGRRPALHGRASGQPQDRRGRGRLPCRQRLAAAPRRRAHPRGRRGTRAGDVNLGLEARLGRHDPWLLFDLRRGGFLLASRRPSSG
jgi:phosphohistidine swiveling domain-containing protein